MSFQNSPPQREGLQAFGHRKMVNPSSQQSHHKLSLDIVRSALFACGEPCNLEQVSFYPDIESMAARQRESKNWSQGEIFVFSRAENCFLIAKQIAPSSCEFLVVTHDGYQDVLTAYLFGKEELVAALKSYIR
ncbi:MULTISPECIES: hypothetical protein [Delftia]|uniref:hypothetical protein n=1 Tax=Delftia TaxID=80865 RepID=UPI000B6FECDB|nr:MULTISPECIES: hypothetical protein [Delftia]OWG12617.1 hypothetical protein KDK82_6044 [Delftia sp. K82]